MHTSREMSAHKKLGAHKNFPLKVCLHIFFHVVLNVDDCWSNVAHRKFCVHTDLKKLEGTLVSIMSSMRTCILHRWISVLCRECVRMCSLHSEHRQTAFVIERGFSVKTGLWRLCKLLVFRSANNTCIVVRCLWKMTSILPETFSQ